ncbi:MAG: nuclear transport factor 2 family protein [Actinomycetota bacterium]|nr:nuclear transport factor 2 family protein [Actinomycetota bacterium]
MTQKGASHPNVALVQAFYEAYAAGDVDRMKREVLSSDVTWAIPGHHPLSGVKRGAQEIAAYFAQLPKANFQAEPLVIAAEGDYVIDVHRGWGSYQDATLDMHWVLVFRIEDGRIKEVENYAADQHAADLFFTRVWGEDLKPIPDRLCGA